MERWKRMVGQGALTGMVLEIILSVGFPVGLSIYLYMKKKLTWKAFGIGIFIFILFARVLEKLLHTAMVDADGTSLKWTESPWAFVLYGGLAAGIFEEIGRYIGMKWFLKDKQGYWDGLSYGVGHGGIEAILVGGFAGLNAILFAHLINAGTLADVVGSQVTPEKLAEIKEHFLSQGFAVYFMGGIERIVAVILQLVYSLIVLLSIRRHAVKFLFLAIGLHAVIDFIPALYQTGLISSIWVTEAIILAIGIVAAYALFKSPKWFPVHE